MSIDQAEVRAALKAFGPGATLDIADEQVELLRYARSRITAQHSERRMRVRVRVQRGGCVVAGSIESLDPSTVDALAAKLSQALTVGPAPEDDVTDRQASGDDGVFDAVQSDPPVTTAAQRCQWFRTIRDGLGDGTNLGGSIRNDVIERVVADAHGRYRAETVTRLNVQAIAERDGRSVSLRTLRNAPSEIDIPSIAHRLREQFVDLPTRERAAGPVRVLLRPQAALTLIATYGYAALGAAGYLENRTAVAGRMGEHVVSDLLTLTDDGTDPAGIPSRFDPAGTLRRRTPLIERGRLVGLVSDQKYAAVTGGVPTGHGVPLGWRFGADPAPSHLLVEPGEDSDQQLLAGLGEGLVISRLDYLRVLHPKDTLVTGTTRDATYWASDGELVAWHPQVRLTFRMDEALRAVRAVGRDRQCGEQPFMESVVAPGLTVDAGPIEL
ncbi:MAG TPA: metallopeptidase TldD-related protein [Nakamurella sp.]|nr:metallopeptidase TldD-related protein [Nakamurella sp.]